MEKFNFKFLLFCLVIFVFCSNPVLLADWNTGEPHKMHYPQLPDSTGWDICLNHQFLADDFMCSETGPITDIHFWISWQGDIDGQVQQWDISIYRNSPVGQPGLRVWTWNGVGNITIRQYGTGLQGWYCPFNNYLNRPDHSMFYQVNITNILEPFTQTQGEIYWLVIRASVMPGPGDPAVGWKTSKNMPPGPLWGNPAKWSMDGINWLTINTGTISSEYHDMAFVITGTPPPPQMNFGDAPEGTTALAYPDIGVFGRFPTCMTVGPANWVQHTNFGAYFGLIVDFELDGNAGLCQGASCFPPYDQDECFADGDAGLIMPQSFTIDQLLNYVTCPQSTGSPLGIACQTAIWGQNIDIDVHNLMPSGTTAYVNVLIDWNRSGEWSGTSFCPTAGTPEHVLVNFPVPPGYQGPLSTLGPPAFLIGPVPGYVWARFSITETPVMVPWDGSGTFADGETEDYLLLVIEGQPELDFGDAPDPTYPTLAASDGARHQIVQGVLMGAAIDADFDGQPNANASGDDLAGVDDEDGVSFVTNPLIPGQWAQVQVDLSNCAAGMNIYLNAWIDFGADGLWSQSGDQIFKDLMLTGGSIYSLLYQVPFYAQPNSATFSRFRISTLAGLSYTGLAPDGEVEDNLVNIGQNKSIKWMQPPDRTSNGIDIKIDQMRRIADDFQCTSHGYITDIHFWASWYEDRVGVINKINVKIFSDDPVGPGGSDPCNTYSKPDELLWHRDFQSGSFSMQPEGEPLYEGEYWWDPVSQMLIPYGDRQIWRIEMDIPWLEAFEQKGSATNPEIYWLSIEAETVQGELGWKTRDWPGHFMDDACLSAGSEPPYMWRDLRYPPGHPHYESSQPSIDMAFALTGIEPKPPTPHIKWSQPPLEMDVTANWPTYCGWNQPSWTQNMSEPLIGLSAADDFRCIGPMPITSIHWWGSYIEWMEEQLPAQQPTAWLVTFWTNVPAVQPGGYSHPGELLKQFRIPAERVTAEWVGQDHFPNMMPESCFQYNVDLQPEEWFWQEQYSSPDNVFWIGIKAIYPAGIPIMNTWGWKTRPAHWMDDAVTIQCYQTGGPCDFRPIEDPTTGESMDLAFELDTEPNWIKWEQPFTGLRNWKHYEDKVSMAYTDLTGYPIFKELVADDWMCTKRTPVTSIVWWGSYLGYRYRPCSGVQTMPARPDSFMINIWTDVPANAPGNPYPYSHPGKKVWEYRAYNYDEVLVGYDKHPEKLDVAICGAPSVASWNNDVQAKLMATGQFSKVDIIDVRTTTPTLAQLQAYKAVLVYSDALYADSNALGNVMADYVDNGGGVVCAMFEIGYGSNLPNPFAQMWGRWNSQGYYVIPRTPQFGPPAATLGTIYDPTHPIMQGVSNFDGGASSYRPIPTTVLPPGVTRVADWSDSSPLVVTKTIGGARRADIGLYPVSSDARSDFWKSTTDGALLMANALTWVGATSTQSPPHEPVFRYSVSLPREKWFKQRKVNQIYWVSIAAVYSYEPQYQWGWTNHKHVFQDDAVSGIPVGGQINPSWDWRELYDQTGESADQSFVLFTDPSVCVACPDYNWDNIVNFIDFADFADQWRWTGPAGGFSDSDLDCNGKVNPADLKIFCDQWLQSCP